MGKLLFITQKVDLDDDVLGIYHRWIKKLSEKVEAINVVCLYRGKVDLPRNVSVYSLGKEIGESRVKYICRFYKYIWGLRNEYGTIFVHMNPIYIILGGIFWKLWGKKILLWYNHPFGNLVVKIGIFFSKKVFCTSRYSFAAKYSKTILMPVGIDTDLFKLLPDVKKSEKRILSIGRISPIKKLECLIEAVKILDAQEVDFELLVVGLPISASDKVYYDKLRKMSDSLLSKGKIIFQPSVPNYKTPAIYCSSAVFVNLTPTGSFDKAILEAMACGVPVLVSNASFEEIFNQNLHEILMFKPNDSLNLSEKIKFLLTNQNTKDLNILGIKLRELVMGKHDLISLLDKLAIFIV